MSSPARWSGGGNCGQPDNQQPGPASGAGAQAKGNRGARGPAGGARDRAEGAEERMSTNKGLGRLYDRLTPEERFRLDVLALARGDEEESVRLTRTCPRRGYTMNDWGFVGRWAVARELAMFAYMDVASPLDKIKTMGVFRDLCPQLGTIWQNDVHCAYFDGHRAGSLHAWKRSGKAGEPPGWEADERAAGRNADPAMYEDLRKRAGDGMYAHIEE